MRLQRRASGDGVVRSPRWRWALPGLAVLCTLLGCDQPRPDVRIVAFGDSTTSGPTGRDYIEFLAEMLQEPAGTWANEGAGGETTVEGLERLRLLLDRGMFPNAEALLYWQGGNDLIDAMRTVDPLLLFSPASTTYPFSVRLDELLDDIQEAIETAVALAQQVGLQVFVANYYFLPYVSLDCDPLPLDVLLPGQAANANDYVVLLNERIGQAALTQGAVLVDVAGLDDRLRSEAGNYENCNHLSEAGNAIVAELFAQQLVEHGF